MAAKMRSSSIEPKPADEDAETAGLDLMSLLVNPDSFCETAENFFDLSFLVKDARATVGVDDSTGLPVCRLAEAPDGAVPKTQNVVVLSMADCKAIGELWGIEKPQLPREAGARGGAGGRGRPPPPRLRGRRRGGPARRRVARRSSRPAGRARAARLSSSAGGEVPPK